MGDPVQLELDFGSPSTTFVEGTGALLDMDALRHERAQQYVANDVQVGGQHYKQLEFQPWDVITSWGLGFLDGNVVKYIARWRSKDGLKDLHKARHYLDKLIENEQAKS